MAVPRDSGGRTRGSDRPPAHQHDDQRDIAHRIDRERREGAGRRDDDAADRRPTLRAMLKPMLLSAIAAGRSERGTISPTSDCQAGPLNAVPQPIRNVKASRSQGVTSPK